MWIDYQLLKINFETSQKAKILLFNLSNKLGTNDLGVFNPIIGLDRCELSI